MRGLLSKMPLWSRLISRWARGGASSVALISDVSAIEIDHNGSPVSRQPSEWFVCFVPGLQKQWWHRFTNPRHQHVFALKMVGEDQWIIFESWWTRIMVTSLSMDEAVKFLRWGAAGSILRVMERIPGNGNQARGWSNCAVLVSLMLGRSYLTWTPHGLYRRLLAEKGVEPVELFQFFEEKLSSITRRMTGNGSDDFSAFTTLSPEAAFTELGKRISKIMFSATFTGLYRLAASEAPRFPTSAGAVFTRGLHQAVASVKSLVSHFCETGQFRTCDQERTSRAFMSMLRGNFYLEIALGCRTEPDERDLELRTKFVVDFFLHGANRRVSHFEPYRDQIRMKTPEIAA